MDETLRDIQAHFYWPGMRRDTRKYVTSCHLCICTKALRTAREDVQKPRTPRNAWDTVALDLMGPYPTSSTGKKFVLVVTDLFTRWTEVFPTGSSTAPTIISLMEREVFPRWGYPKQILSDNGRQFIGHKWIDACRRWDCELWTTPVYHPRANPTERRNQEIKKGIRLRIDQGVTADETASFRRSRSIYGEGEMRLLDSRRAISCSEELCVDQENGDSTKPTQPHSRIDFDEKRTAEPTRGRTSKPMPIPK